MEDHHRLVQLDEGLGNVVFDAFLGCVECILIPIDLLDDL